MINPLTWQQFIRQPHIARLTEGKQVQQYNWYMMSFMNVVKAGSNTVVQNTPPPTYTTLSVTVDDGATGAPTGFAFDMIPTVAPGKQSNVVIDWGDGNSNTYVLDSSVGTLTPTHTYSGVIGAQTAQIQLDNEIVLTGLNFPYWSNPSTNGNLIIVPSGLETFSNFENLTLSGNTLYASNPYVLNLLNLTQFTAHNTQLSNVTFGNVTSLIDFSANNSTIMTLDIGNGNLNNCLSFRISGCDVSDKGQINNILVQLDANGLSGGIVDLSGGTNATPDTQGLAAVANLIAKGWSVSTN